jgi:hypothetical protein
MGRVIKIFSPSLSGQVIILVIILKKIKAVTNADQGFVGGISEFESGFHIVGVDCFGVIFRFEIVGVMLETGFDIRPDLHPALGESGERHKTKNQNGCSESQRKKSGRYPHMFIHI